MSNISIMKETTKMPKSIQRYARRHQEAFSKDVKISELFNIYKVADIKLSAQRYKESISKKSIKVFALRVIDGLIHQNLTLANIQECFQNTKDENWITLRSHKTAALKYLILDGQHRLDMIHIIMTSNPGDYLTEDQLIDFSESFLSVRFITKMNYDDLGNTFISNNCGKPISAQDQLTFLDTDVSNYIVQQTGDNWKAVGETFSSVNKINNSRRKLDKEVRCTAMLYSSNPSHNFNWSFSEAKDFYENGKISDFASALNTWFSCLKFLSGNGRGKTAKGLRLLVYIFQGNYSQSDKFNLKDTKTLVSEFIKWEQSRYDSREIIEYFKSGNTKLATYKELCTSHSDAEICKRTNIIEEEFVIPNLQKWLANSVISKRLSRQVFTT
jgi:hypothetical protein